MGRGPLLLGALLLACGTRSELREGIPADAGSTDVAAAGTFHLECAGPNYAMVYFAIGDPEPTCDMTKLQPGQHILNMWIGRHAGQLPTGTFTLPVIYGSSLSTAEADACIGPDASTCEPAIKGTLSLSNFDPASGSFADGSYDLDMDDKYWLAGSFHVARCPEPNENLCF